MPLVQASRGEGSPARRRHVSGRVSPLEPAAHERRPILSLDFRVSSVPAGPDKGPSQARASPGRRRRAVPCGRMTDEPNGSFVDRLSRQGEEALGRIAEELISNPVVNRAITGAFEAREKAVQAQEAAMGALNIPSAADVERLTRRLRSVSQRLEGIEDALDRLEEKAGAAAAAAGEGGSAAVESRLEEIARDIAALREAVAPAAEPVSRAQERLTVSDAGQ